MRVIAIDPGTLTGYATSDGLRWTACLKPLPARKGRPGRPNKWSKDGRLIREGTEPVPPCPAEPEYARCGKLWRLLDELWRDGAMEARLTVVCEGAAGFMKGKAAVRVSNELRGVVKAWAWVRGAAYVEIQPQDLQRFVTGRCQVPKEEMLRLAREKYGHVTDDNEGDALHLLAWARRHVLGEAPERAEAS